MGLLKNKEWWKSKTVWAAGAALLVAVATAAFGETSTVTAITIAVLSALGLYGRMTATKALI